jgi:hypothetical protein
MRVETCIALNATTAFMFVRFVHFTYVYLFTYYYVLYYASGASYVIHMHHVIVMYIQFVTVLADKRISGINKD